MGKVDCNRFAEFIVSRRWYPEKRVWGDTRVVRRVQTQPQASGGNWYFKNNDGLFEPFSQAANAAIKQQERLGNKQFWVGADAGFIPNGEQGNHPKDIVLRINLCVPDSTPINGDPRSARPIKCQ